MRNEIAVLAAGCSRVKDKPGPSALYQKVYEATDPRKAGMLKPGSPEEKAAVERFKDFLSVISEEQVRTKLRQTYADDAYFNDTLKEISDVATLEKYLLKTAENVDSCTVEFLDTASAGGEYYFRWLMTVRFKKFKKGEDQPSIGITHIRFNKEGKVVFHQDYWDASENFFEKIPVLGWMIRKVKGSL
jgi:limonene-1,2-epoxide hydrolase